MLLSNVATLRLIGIYDPNKLNIILLLPEFCVNRSEMAGADN
jgi:hypothetical protein